MGLKVITPKKYFIWVNLPSQRTNTLKCLYVTFYERTMLDPYRHTIQLRSMGSAGTTPVVTITTDAIICGLVWICV